VAEFVDWDEKMDTADLANVARASLAPSTTSRNAQTGQMSATRQVFLDPFHFSRREEIG
jgi:hypothetical protein